MACAKPYVTKQGEVHGCGRCLPCKIKARRVWTHRLMLELTFHGVATFVTLTYSDEKLSTTPNGLPTLSPDDLQLFMKRLRRNLERSGSGQVRFFAVGEYGTITERPHYHLILYNYPPCSRGQTVRGGQNCCSSCSMIFETWGKGGVLLGSVTPESMQYVAGYTVKKMTSQDDPRLNGRHPEFSRQSRRPGIGFKAVEQAVTFYQEFGPIPRALQHGRKILPYGSYLTKKLKDRGVEFAAYEDKLQTVREAAGFKTIDAEAYSQAWAKYGPTLPNATSVKLGNAKLLQQALAEEGQIIADALENREKPNKKDIL